MERSTKQQQNLRREMNTVLRDFERNREWADFSHWLHRLLDVLGSRKCPILPQQLTLCKRLAQCLNPSLPAGVHSTVLKAYQTILNNYGDKVELLPLTAMGLFPYFEHSNIQNKITVLKIFEEHFIVETEGIQMIVGLTNALLTVFNQNSEELAKRVYAILQKVSSSFGRMWVDGAIWVNILKSPKVRLAGFKYFQKVFRDRDRVNQQEQIKISEEVEREMFITIEKKIQASGLSQEEKILLTTVYGYRCRPDDHLTRFPNFSSLILNGLSVCLEVTADNMIKRASLDLLGSYLKLNSGVFGREEGVIILQKMLLMLQLKEYSLTNRVYKYLFDQPNSEGIFHINLEKKSYELQILKQALKNLLISSHKSSENVLIIMEILISDHPTLAEFLLEGLAFEIVSFAQAQQNKLKKQSNLTKTVADFYLNVVLQNRRTFLPALLKKIPKKNQELDPLGPSFTELLQVLYFYFSRMEKLTVEPKLKANIQSCSEEQKMDESREKVEFLTIRVETLSQLIDQLWQRRPFEEQKSLRILDLCNELLAEVHISCESKEEGLSQQQIDKIETLLTQEAENGRKNLYAKLLTLHPKPRKQMLLPYIEDSSLSIVCINLLLGGDKLTPEVLRPRAFSGGKSRVRSSTIRSGSLNQIYGQPLQLTQRQQEAVFFAIFKLLNCHLFQGRALEFIERFQSWWRELFVQLIDRVEPSEWLIYWKKVEGDVSGGILRMVENLNSQNSYYKHLSKKWISQSENIISKILDAIYLLLEVGSGRKESIQEEGVIQFKQWNIAQYERIFNLVQLVFKSTSAGFTRFFFLQKDKYLTPLVLYVFKCLENDNYVTKSRSLALLSFILSQAGDPREIIDVLSLTLPNVLAILDAIIDRKKSISLKQNNEYENELLKISNFEIELLEYSSLSIKKGGQIPKGNERVEEGILSCLRNSSIYDTILKGIIFTDSNYIKDLYIESSKELCEMLAKIDYNRMQITGFITRILDKLFILLKNSDANRIEGIIKSRNETSPKESLSKRNVSNHEDLMDAILYISKETVLQTEIKENLNLEEKYAEIIELWNTVKFYLQFALKLELKEIPIINLLSLALTSFPLAYLKYTTVGSSEHAANLDVLDEEIANVTGLKKEVFEIFQILWNKESKQIVDFLIEKSDPRILIHSQLDPSKVLEAINRSSKMKEIITHLKSGKSNLPRNMLYYNLELLMKENQLLFFLYTYLLYCNLRLLRGKRTSSFFEALLDTLHKLRISSHVQTKLWLLELMELIGHRIVSPKELSVQNAGNIRHQLQLITKELLDEVQAIITKSKSFTHKLQIKTGIFSIFNKQEKQNAAYDFVKIFPPTIFQQFDQYKQLMKKSHQIKSQIKEKESQILQKGNLEHPRQRLSSYLQHLNTMTAQQENPIDNIIFGRFINIPDTEFPDYLSICCLRTLIRIGNSVLLNIFDKDINRISIIVKEILMNLLPISENRQPSNQHFNELIAQYLNTVLAHEQLRPDVLRTLRRQILEVYMADNFFKCTQRTLTHWKAIIDYCIGDNNDLLSELLSKEGLFEGIFTKKAESTRQKIKSFERVCFLIYAGRVDRYDNKLRTVLESLNEVMKQQDASPSLLILILFCIRILLMRLSVISLNKLFKSVWPSLITLLIQIFRRQKTGKNINLHLAALKVIELIHAMELEEFMLHKWMFIFDYFGLRIDPMGQIQDNLRSCEMLTPFHFKPYFINALPNNRLKCRFVPEKSQNPTSVPVKRRLIVKKTYIQSEEDLKESALLLMQYMMDLNECQCEISKSDIEGLIQDEFISLDNYIFKVK